MRAATLLVIVASWGAAWSAAAQTNQQAPVLNFETPSLSMIGRSLMRLFEQHHWIDVAYVRSIGVKVEAALPGLDDRALRIDSGLALRIDGHRILRLFDQPEVRSEAGPITHIFRTWLSGPRFYVVSVSCNECAVTYLIDERDGRVADIIVPPLMSPSGQFGVLWELNFMGGGWPGPPAIIDFRSHPPVIRSVVGFPNCEQRPIPARLRATPVWVDESRITFDGGPALPSDDPNTKQVLRVIAGKPEWEC
jgi:hypothetical protein